MLHQRKVMHMCPVPFYKILEKSSTMNLLLLPTRISILPFNSSRKEVECLIIVVPSLQAKNWHSRRSACVRKGGTLGSLGPVTFTACAMHSLPQSVGYSSCFPGLFFCLLFQLFIFEARGTCGLNFKSARDVTPWFAPMQAPKFICLQLTSLPCWTPK
jgi:hypothetical protein